MHAKDGCLNPSPTGKGAGVRIRALRVTRTLTRRCAPPSPGGRGKRRSRLAKTSLGLYAFPRRVDLAGARFGAAAQVLGHVAEPVRVEFADQLAIRALDGALVGIPRHAQHRVRIGAVAARRGAVAAGRIRAGMRPIAGARAGVPGKPFHRQQRHQLDFADAQRERHPLQHLQLVVAERAVGERHVAQHVEERHHRAAPRQAPGAQVHQRAGQVEPRRLALVEGIDRPAPPQRIEFQPRHQFLGDRDLGLGHPSIALGQRPHQGEQRFDIAVLAAAVGEPGQPAAVQCQMPDHHAQQGGAEVAARHHQADHEADQLAPNPHGRTLITCPPAPACTAFAPHTSAPAPACPFRSGGPPQPASPPPCDRPRGIRAKPRADIDRVVPRDWARRGCAPGRPRRGRPRTSRAAPVAAATRRLPARSRTARPRAACMSKAICASVQFISGRAGAAADCAPRYNGRFMPRSNVVPTTLLQSDLPGLELLHRGKVRDVYGLSGDHLLIVATDRLSAFDVVLPDPIPGKGEMLCQISNFWFAQTAHLVPNHLTGKSVAAVLPAGTDAALYTKRSVVTKRLKPVPVEAIARGYLIGSGWKDYQATGSLCGIALPAGLKQAQQLPEPIFTPSTKAAVGDHDQNVSFEVMVDKVGADLASQVRDATLAIYGFAAAYAAERGIIIADTKFEFGTDANGKLYVMDEMLTPDSSRFWPADQYKIGISPPSYDKQFVRDYLETLDCNKRAPGPKLPREVIDGTAAKYAEALQKLAGISLTLSCSPDEVAWRHHPGRFT